MKRSFSILFVSLFALVAFAQKIDFYNQNFGFEIISVSNKTVAIKSVDYWGDYAVVIPQTATYNGIDFTVEQIDFFRNSPSSWAKSITIPKSINYIGFDSFYNTAFTITDIIIEDSDEELDCTALQYINDCRAGQFTRTKLKNLYLGRNLTYYKYYSYSSWTKFPPFQYALITSSDGETGLGTAGLENLIIGENVTDISHFDLFQYYKELKTITLKCKTPPSLPTPITMTFSNLQYISLQIIVPKGSLNVYKETYPWNQFLNISEAEEASVERIEDTKIQHSISNGTLRFTSPCNFVVYRLDGTCLYKGYSDYYNLPQKGMYIVKYLDQTFKIVI